MSPASATCSECSPGDLGLENSPREDVSDPPVIPPTTNLHPLLLAEFPGLWLWDTGCGAITRGTPCRFTGWASLHFKILSLNFYFIWEWQIPKFVWDCCSASFWWASKIQSQISQSLQLIFFPKQPPTAILSLSSVEEEPSGTSVANSTVENCWFRLCWGLLCSSITHKCLNELCIDSIIGAPANPAKHTKL